MQTPEMQNKSTDIKSRPGGFGKYIIPAAALLAKDIKCEVRNKHAAGSILLFALTSTIAVSLMLNGWGGKSQVSAALLWIVIYFSAMMGLSRSFVREEEQRTAAVLKLSIPPVSVYIGKLLFNFLLLAAVEIIAVPLFIVMMGCSVENAGAMVIALFLGTLGLCAGGTIAAAMISKATTKGALYAVICFPLLIPVIAVAIQATDYSFAGGIANNLYSNIKLLVFYCGGVITASIMLFGFIWED